MSSVTVTENNNKVSVDKTTNVVTVTSPGTVGPQGGAGTIESATATATAVAVDENGLSQNPTAAITLGGTAEARTMAFAFGVPTGASGVIDSIVTTGTDGIEIDSGGTMDSFASTIQLGINAQTLWTHILAANVTGNLVVTGNLTATGNLTVSGTTTTIDTTVTVSDAVVVNNAGSDVGVKVNSTSTGHIMQLQDNGTDVFVVNDGGKVAVGVPGNAASLLHLRGPSGADTDLRLEGTPGSADGIVANIDAYHGSNNVGKIRFKRGADAADGEIEFFTANDTLNSAAMHIDQNSKVGINTVTPSTPLDVNGTATATAFAGPLTGDVTGDVTGNADTATALETARTIGGVSFNGTANISLPGVNATGNQDTSGTATTATTATNVTVADESSDAECFPLFVTAATGGLPPKSGTNLTFNSSTGVLTATGFAGPISGAVTGNAATATALATGRTIGMTGDVVWTSASFDGSGNVTGTATIQANSVAMGTDTTGDYVATVTAGTGLTSTGATSGESIAHSLSVDAAQTQITSVGTIGTGTWQGTAVAQSYIADQAINEAKMQISNAPTNGYVLTAQSGNTGGMTWADLGTSFDVAGSGIAMAIALG